MPGEASTRFAILEEFCVNRLFSQAIIAMKPETVLETQNLPFTLDIYVRALLDFEKELQVGQYTRPVSS